MLQPEIAAALAALPSERTTEPSDLPLKEALALVRGRPLPPQVADKHTRIEDAVAELNGLATPVRIYRPVAGAAQGIAINFHGGGWVTGSPAQDDYLCQIISREAGCVVISADYPLAPEHPFPLPLDHCASVLEWASTRASSLGASGNKIALVGSSAGGNLAAALALRARDQGGPSVAAQILLYPILDCDVDTPSYHANATGFSLTRKRMMWFWDQYVPAAARRTDPLASPLRAKSLKGLPPTVIAVGCQDPLRDEAANYAARLKEAGVPVTYLDFDGVVHGFLRMTPDAPWTKATLTATVDTLKSALRG